MRSIRNVPVLLATAAIVALPLLDSAHSADQPPHSAAPTLGTVTVEAAREKREVMRQASRFLFSATVNYLSDSLPRWNRPICPLVAGLPREEGEYVLTRISQIAAAADAPLAGARCKPNLFIVATPHPDQLLENWWARDARMYNDCSGLGGIKKFLHSKRPVRVWYNTVPPEAGPDDAGPSLLGMNLPASGCISSDGGELGLSQVFVIVDMRKITGLNIGQFSDYVSMLGLAQIQLDSVAQGPSILTLFENSKHSAEGLSDWDRALLYALYTTPQSAPPVQVSQMRRSMVSQILSARWSARAPPKPQSAAPNQQR